MAADGTGIEGVVVGEQITASALDTSSGVDSTRVTTVSIELASTTCGSAARTSAPIPASSCCDPEGRRLPRVTAVLLVGEAQQQDARSLDRAAALVERHHQPADDIVRHVIIDVVSQLDETEALPERTLDPPGQIARVDRETMANLPPVRG